MVEKAMPLVMNTMARGNPSGSQVLSGSLESATAYSELFLCVRKTCSPHCVIGGGGVIFLSPLLPPKPDRARFGAGAPGRSAADFFCIIVPPFPQRRGGSGFCLTL